MSKAQYIQANLIEGWIIAMQQMHIGDKSKNPTTRWSDIIELK